MGIRKVNLYYGMLSHPQTFRNHRGGKCQGTRIDDDAGTRINAFLDPIDENTLMIGLPYAGFEIQLLRHLLTQLVDVS